MPASNARKSTAAKKTTASRNRATGGDTPAAPAFNFDTWNRGEEIDPFPIVIGGERYVSEDPVDIDFRALTAGMEDPERMFRELFPNDHEEILANPIPVGALARFNEAIGAHFGLEDFIAPQS